MGYRNVRSLERGLDVISALNLLKAAKAAEISSATGIHRTTVHRLLETLRTAGFVYLSAADDTYRLTHRVHDLSSGMDDEDRLVERAAEALPDLAGRVRWPSDLNVPRRDAMVVRESSHRQSPWSPYSNQVGSRWPYLHSSVGRAYLAFCEAERREHVLETLRRSRDPRDACAADAAYVAALLRRTREDGYGQSCLEVASRIAAIALPVRDADDRVVAAVNLIFFASAMTTAEAAERYLPELRAAVAAIEGRAGVAEAGPEPARPGTRSRGFEAAHGQA